MAAAMAVAMTHDGGDGGGDGCRAKCLLYDRRENESKIDSLSDEIPHQTLK